MSGTLFMAIPYVFLSQYQGNNMILLILFSKPVMKLKHSSHSYIYH